MKKNAVRLTALLIAAVTVFAFIPQTDAAAYAPGYSKGIIEQYYNVEVKIDMRTKWAKKLDWVYDCTLEGLKAFPEGLLSQAFEFYELDHGKKLQILFRAKRATDPAIAAAYFQYSANQIVVLVDSSDLAEIVTHELAHMVHYYLIYYYGDKALSDAMKSPYYVSEYAKTNYFEDFAETLEDMYFRRDSFSEAVKNAMPPAEKYKAVGYALTSRASTQSLGVFDGFFTNNFTYLGYFETYGRETDKWLKGDVRAAAELGLIPPDDFLLGDYQQPLTRLEFTFIAARLMERISGQTMIKTGEKYGAKPLTMKSYLPFDDIDDVGRFDAIVNLYYMKELGIINGVSRGKFAPDTYISGTQARTLLTGIAKLFGYSATLKEADTALTREGAVKMSYELYTQMTAAKAAA